MGAVDLGGVEPQIVLPGQLEGQLIILPVVAAHIDGITIGGNEPHGGQLALLGAFFAGIGLHITPGLQFLPDLLQLLIRGGPVQLVKNALQIAQLIPADLHLSCQLLLGVFHPGVVLVEFRCVLLGGKDGGQRNLNGLHVLIVEILSLNHSLTLGDPVEVGDENVTQLPQPLPVIGGCQLLFLDGQLPGQPLAEICDRFAEGLTFLPHGVLIVPAAVKAVQQRGKTLGGLVFSVLTNGAESKLLRCAVRAGGPAGGGMVQLLCEEQLQLFGGGRNVQPVDPGIGVPGGIESGLPADQGGQAAQGIHQPVRQNIGARFP